MIYTFLDEVDASASEAVWFSGESSLMDKEPLISSLVSLPAQASLSNHLSIRHIFTSSLAAAQGLAVFCDPF